MAIKIEIVSEETIKPLKYKNFKPYKLSMLDQQAPSLYVPMVFFYSSPDNNNNLPNPKTSINNNITIIQSLKLSLSKTLETFYPLAGRISGDGARVETGPNDGVLFKEARVVGIDLATALEKPINSLVGSLIPIDPTAGEEFPVTMVQSNAFLCGGLALGICMSHKIADAGTCSAFLSAWAESSLGGDVAEAAVVLDTAELLFPPIPGFRLKNPPGLLRPLGEVVTRRFAFDAASLARLRSEASSGSIVPTRVEAVTALISGAAARTKTKCPSTTEAILHAVNLRPRTKPPLPENTIGNLWAPIVATVRELSDGEGGLSNVVVEMRRELKKVDAEKLEGPENFWLRLERLMSDSSVSFMKFSSWVKVGFYEVDFGFGRPEMIALTTFPVDGMVFLMSDKSGGGIEAWVNIDPRHMSSFEADQTLLSFASLCP